ncbi:MAG: amidohydrolase family protein [Desulfatibacillaceae bacterium]|nr:amidohydrolase family protein [Desulfatibacillaceae bacterium]
MNAIVDAHAHLGDVLNPQGAKIIGSTGLKKPRFFDLVLISEMLLHRRSFAGNALARLAWRVVARADQARSRCASLENLLNSMQENGVSHTVCMPIAPAVKSADLLSAAKNSPRIIAFASPDFGQKNFAGLLEDDLRQGAAGVKLHSILQQKPLTDPDTFAAVEIAVAANKPVLFHCGVHWYYPSLQNTPQVPEYGKVEYAKKLVAAFPKARFVAGHAGLYDVRQVIDELVSFKNVWVDTSIQPPETVRALVKAFGPERVLFASDWPFGSQKTAIRIVEKACKKDKSLMQRIFADNAKELLGLK